MMADEGSQTALHASVEVTRGAVKVSAVVASLSWKLLMGLLGMSIAGLETAKSRVMDTGKMSLSHLQKVTGGDLHAQQVSPEMLRSVKADLRRRGVSFSVEKGADGKTYVHFAGKDVDTVRHGLEQAAARLGKGREARGPEVPGKRPSGPPPLGEPGRGAGAGRAGRPRSKAETLKGMGDRSKKIASKAPSQSMGLKHSVSKGAR